MHHESTPSRLLVPTNRGKLPARLARSDYPETRLRAPGLWRTQPRVIAVDSSERRLSSLVPMCGRGNCSFRDYPTAVDANGSSHGVSMGYPACPSRPLRWPLPALPWRPQSRFPRIDRYWLTAELGRGQWEPSIGRKTPCSSGTSRSRCWPTSTAAARAANSGRASSRGTRRRAAQSSQHRHHLRYRRKRGHAIYRDGISLRPQSPGNHRTGRGNAAAAADGGGHPGRPRAGLRPPARVIHRDIKPANIMLQRDGTVNHGLRHRPCTGRGRHARRDRHRLAQVHVARADLGAGGGRAHRPVQSRG